MSSTCKNCGCNKIDCGCKDSFLTSPAPCPTPEDCPEAQPCSEVFDAQCIVYTGQDIDCGETTVVSTNDTVAEALNNIVQQVCTAAANVTLTSAGGTQSLVNDGTGPSLVTKGLSAGTGISLSSTSNDITITNSAPDQIVALTSGIGIGISGTYPNFTITNTASNITFQYEIGQYVSAQGGVIAHRWLSAFPPGSQPTAGIYQNYLVIDTQDLSVGAPWATLDVSILNTDSTWNGQMNSGSGFAAGAGSGITPGTAIVLCESSTNNGKTDWYLPAIDELVKIWVNRWEIAQGILVAGGTQLTFNNYWSSSASAANLARNFTFNLGFSNVSAKSNSNYVRAIRKFSI